MAQNPWLVFVAHYRAKHPGMAYSEVLHKAGIEYRKLTGKPKGKKGGLGPYSRTAVNGPGIDMQLYGPRTRRD